MRKFNPAYLIFLIPVFGIGYWAHSEAECDGALLREANGTYYCMEK